MTSRIAIAVSCPLLLALLGSAATSNRVDPRNGEPLPLGTVYGQSLIIPDAVPGQLRDACDELARMGREDDPVEVLGDLLLVPEVIQEIARLECDVAVEGYLFVSDSSDGSREVRDLSGLERIVRAGKGLYVTNTRHLEDLSGLGRLRQLGGLGMKGNLALTSLDGLDGLDATGEVRLENNPLLERIDALAGAAILGPVVVRRNPVLADLTGLGGLQASRHGWVKVQECHALSAQARQTFDEGVRPLRPKRLIDGVTPVPRILEGGGAAGDEEVQTLQIHLDSHGNPLGFLEISAPVRPIDRETAGAGPAYMRSKKGHSGPNEAFRRSALDCSEDDGLDSLAHCRRAGGDFSSFEIVDLRSSAVITAGTGVWSGCGALAYPLPLRSAAELGDRGPAARAPRRTVTHGRSSRVSPEEWLGQVRGFEAVRDWIGSSAYDALLYTHRYSSGGGDPLDETLIIVLAKD